MCVQCHLDAKYKGVWLGFAHLRVWINTYVVPTAFRKP